MSTSDESAINVITSSSSPANSSARLRSMLTGSKIATTTGTAPTSPPSSSSSSPSGDALTKLASFWKKKPATPKAIRTSASASPLSPIPGLLPNTSALALKAATKGRESVDDGDLLSKSVNDGKSQSPNADTATAAAVSVSEPNSPPVAFSQSGSLTKHSKSASDSFDSANAAAATVAAPPRFTTSSSYYSNSSIAAFKQSILLSRPGSLSNNDKSTSPIPPPDQLNTSVRASSLGSLSTPTSAPSSPVISPLISPRKMPRAPSIDTTLASLMEKEPQSKRLRNILALLQDESLDLNALRRQSWNGCPAEVRSLVWKILLGFIPVVRKRRDTALHARRLEYGEYLLSYEEATNTGSAVSQSEETIALLRQIRADIPRTSPGLVFFKLSQIQLSLERVLYVFAVRHTASGYVQGMNDLVTPFYAVFIKDHLPAIDINVNAQVESLVLSDDSLAVLEADCYWCLSLLIDHIQDHFTFAQPGIQRQIYRMQEVVERVDQSLYRHLEASQIQFLHFAFRWMNCLLMRELSLPLIVRLWDSYLSDDANNGFKIFHVYFCVAFLVKFAPQLKLMEFADLIIYLQKLPTEAWGEQEIATLIAQAYLYQSLYEQAR